MDFRLPLAGGFVFFLIILGGCGVMGDPIPYTQTESYRKAQAERDAQARAGRPTPTPGKSDQSE